MAKDILKEAIADAKAVREVALANAKAALEEAFTPKLQSMLSAKLSEELNENEEEDLEEDTRTSRQIDQQDSRDYSGTPRGKTNATGVSKGMYEDEEGEDTMDEGENLDEEIDLEEILNELELEEGEEATDETVEEGEEAEGDETIDETEEGSEDTIDEVEGDEGEEVEEGYQEKVNAQATDIQNVGYKSTNLYEKEKEFDLDALLEEINNLDENEEDEVNEEVESLDEINPVTGQEFGAGANPRPNPFDNRKGDLGDPAASLYDSYEDWVQAMRDWAEKTDRDFDGAMKGAHKIDALAKKHFEKAGAMPQAAEASMYETLEKELEETKAALEVKTSELNEVNLLNSKLLYVNRIFKANNLDNAQKLRVVETLDNATNIKEAKLIYETIKDTFTISKENKRAPKKSIREGLGMASKAAGTSTAPKKEVISESNDMISRFQKLANIKINQ